MKKMTNDVAYDFRSLLANTAGRLSEKDYLIYKRGGGLESVTFGGFEERVRALSEAFLELGLGGASIAVIGETSPEWIITYLATIITGGVMVFSTLISLVRREPIGGKTYLAAGLACLSTILILF